MDQEQNLNKRKRYLSFSTKRNQIFIFLQAMENKIRTTSAHIYVPIKYTEAIC